MFPAVYALLPAKTQEVYESMFELLISHAETNIRYLTSFKIHCEDLYEGSKS